jgi:hypothetical protein
MLDIVSNGINLNFTEEVTPNVQQKYNLSLESQQTLQKQLELMLQKDAIEVTTETGEIISPMFTIPKFNNNWRSV